MSISTHMTNRPETREDKSTTVYNLIRLEGTARGTEAQQPPDPGDTAGFAAIAQEVLGTHQKALKINLDPTKYGTFAEIGAGQEVARWFFRVGGAAGTIAKTISAYD